MATYTTHYNFPKYEAGDLPNLLDQYNNFADGADNQLYTQSQAVTTAQTAATNAQSAAEQATAAVAAKAPINHADTGTTYGAATTTQYGHVRLSDDISADEGTATVPSMSAVNNLKTQVDELAEGGGNYAPINHASDETTYGVGTSSLFGHVKVSQEYGTTVGGNGVALGQAAGYQIANIARSAQSTATSVQSIVSASPVVLQPNTAANASATGGSGTSGTCTANAILSPVGNVITVKLYLSSGFNPGINRTNQDIQIFKLDSQYTPTSEVIQLIATDQHTTSGQVTNVYVVVRTDGYVCARITSSTSGAASGFGNDTGMVAFIYGVSQ